MQLRAGWPASARLRLWRLFEEFIRREQQPLPVHNTLLVGFCGREGQGSSASHRLSWWEQESVSTGGPLQTTERAWKPLSAP